jgi:hypothetical protein
MQLLGVTRWIIASEVSYPNEKLYVGLDLTGTMLHFGSPSVDIAADFMPEQHRDVTIRKQILGVAGRYGWGSPRHGGPDDSRAEVERSGGWVQQVAEATESMKALLLTIRLLRNHAQLSH